jgi:DNA-binding PadR family transcriptional regulator
VATPTAKREWGGTRVAEKTRVPTTATRTPAPVLARLPATANALLGLLSFGEELSGYELKKWADHSLSLFFWSPATSQIYGELRRLEKYGYVTSREVPQDDLRNKRVYRITDAGVDAVSKWLTNPGDVPVLKHPVLLRVWLGHLVEPAQLRDIIEEHRDRTEQRLTQLQRDLAIVQARQKWAYPELIIRWAQRYHQAERDNAEQLLHDLEELQQP